MKTILLYVSVVLCLSASVYAQGLNWLKQIKNPSEQGQAGVTIQGAVVDASGNVYVVGQFASTINFDASHSVGPSVGKDIWFAKYDNNGNYVWGKALIGGGDETAEDIALDNSGNLYIVGTFDGDSPLNFNPGTGSRGEVYLSPSAGMYCAKYSCTNGSYVKAICVGSYTLGTAIAISVNSNPSPIIFMAGQIPTSGASTTLTGTKYIAGGNVTPTGASLGSAVA